jgi:outer membrane lipoprotein-sorting protein
LILFTLLMPQVHAELTPDDILKRSDGGKMPDLSISFQVSVKDLKSQAVERETRYEVWSKGRDASLIKTLFPERQRGRKMLMEGDNMWIYTPDIRRPARVGMQQKMTGEVSNGDLARTEFSADYDATLAGIEKVEGKDTYHLRLKAKRSGVTYSKIDYWVSKDEVLPVKAVFFAVSGKPLKMGFYSGVKSVFGRKCITKFVVKDVLDPERQSVLSYSNFKRVKIPDQMLAKESLSE